MAATIGSEHASSVTASARPSESRMGAEIPLIRAADLTFRSDPRRETGPQEQREAGTATGLSLSDERREFHSSTGLEKSTPTSSNTWVPSRPTQAFFAAKRKPHLVKLQQYLQRLSASSNTQDQMVTLTLCREQLEMVWEYVDARDEYAAQYFQMIGGGLDEVSRHFAPQRVKAILGVVQQVLDMRLDYAARREARLSLMSAKAFKMPQPSLEDALRFAEEDISDEEEDEEDN